MSLDIRDIEDIEDRVESEGVELNVKHVDIASNILDIGRK